VPHHAELGELRVALLEDQRAGHSQLGDRQRGQADGAAAGAAQLEPARHSAAIAARVRRRANLLQRASWSSQVVSPSFSAPPRECRDVGAAGDDR
jgi:hypothetical protein